MNKEKVIDLLNSLQEDVDNWDREDKKIDKLADETIEALEFAVDVMKKSNVVGTLDINEEKYFVVKG